MVSISLCQPITMVNSLVQGLTNDIRAAYFYKVLLAYSYPFVNVLSVVAFLLQYRAEQL